MLTRRPITLHIFNRHIRHRVRKEWRDFAKWIAAFPDSRAIYNGKQFVCVR